MIDQLLLFTGLIITAYAAYTDWKTTEVPDKLTYFGIAFGLSVRGVSAFLDQNGWFLAVGVLGFVFMAAIGCLLYYTAQWGGGDAKLLMALGALLGIEPYLNQSLIAFLINLLVVGGSYGLVYTVVLGLRHREKASKQLRKVAVSKGALQFKALSYITSLLFLVMAFFAQAFMKTGLIAGAVVIPLTFYLWMFTRAVEDVAFIKKVDPNQLMEGDWVLETITHKGKQICSPKDPGITVEQIAQLKKLKKNGVIKTITMKQGIPFIPAFLLAYLVTLFAGNIILLMT